MKESRYMASTELNQLMWLSAGVQALEIILLSSGGIKHETSMSRMRAEEWQL